MARLAPEYKIRDIEDHIMNASVLPHNPFVNKTWKAHVLTDYSISQEVFEKIVIADNETANSKRLILIAYEKYDRKSSKINETAIVQSGEDGEWCSIGKMIINKTIKSIYKYYISEYGLFGLHDYIFPDTKKWGIVTHIESEIALIGGEKEFIEAFEESMGGRDLLINDIFEVYNSMRPYPHDYFYTLIKSIYGDDIAIEKDDYGASS